MSSGSHAHDAGQAATRLRSALASGDAGSALAWVEHLDEAHRIEVLLGAALRDRREEHAAVAAFLDERLPALLAWLADGAGDDSLDRRAARWVAAGRVPELLPAGGRPLASHERAALASGLAASVPEAAVADALAAGVAPRALLEALDALPSTPRTLARGVRVYLGEPGAPRIHALGVRPLLVLAMAAAPGRAA